MKIFKVTEKKKKNLFRLEDNEEESSSLYLHTSDYYPLEIGDVAIFKHGVDSSCIIEYDKSPFFPYFTVSFQDKKDLKEFLKRNYKTENNEDILFLYNFFSSSDKEEKNNVLTKINSTFSALLNYSTKNLYNFGFEEKIKYNLSKQKINQVFKATVKYDLVVNFYRAICEQIYKRCFYLLGLKDCDIKNYLYCAYENIFTEKKGNIKRPDPKIQLEYGWYLSSYTTVKKNFIEDIFIFLKKNPYLFINNNFLSEKIVKTYYHPDVFHTVNNQLSIFGKLYKKVSSSNNFSVSLEGIENEKEIIEILQEKEKVLKEVYNLIFIRETKRLYIGYRYEMEKSIKKFILENNSKIEIITGGPGTGKTTLISKIEEGISSSSESLKILFLSFTGKAVCKIKEKVKNKSECKTIHCALTIENKKEKEEKSSSSYDAIIIDETSMVSAELFYKLFIKKPVVKFTFKKLFLIGDPNQLPPIEWGNVFELAIEQSSKNVKILTVNYRQNDYLKKVVKTFLETGTLQDIDSKFILNYSSNEELKSILLSIKDNKPDNLLFISPVNRICEIVNNIFSKGFSKGEKVILNENIYTETKTLIPNGAIGEIEIKQKKQVKILDDELNYQFFPLEEKFFSLCYCLTVHKMQGSECDDLILILSNECLDFVDKKLLYTAISRPKNKLIILTDVQDIKKKKFY